jgi:hypothetical protein
MGYLKTFEQLQQSPAIFSHPKVRRWIGSSKSQRSSIGGNSISGCAVLLDRESNGRNSGISLSVSRCCPKLLLQTKWRNGGGGQKLCPHFSASKSRAGRSRLVKESRALPRGRISQTTRKKSLLRPANAERQQLPAAHSAEITS